MSEASDSTQQRGTGAEDTSDLSHAVCHGRCPTNTSAVGHRRQRSVHVELIYFLQQDGDCHHDSGTVIVTIITVMTLPVIIYHILYHSHHEVNLVYLITAAYRWVAANLMDRFACAALCTL